MKIIHYILISFALIPIYKWIKKQIWVYQNSPGNDIPRSKYKNIYSPKIHTQIENSSSQITSINMFIESYRLLDLSLFTREELSEQMINDAYTKRLNEHVNCIQKGKESNIDLSLLKSAREYLIQSLNHPRKTNNGAIN